MVQGNFATLDPDGDNLGALAAAAESCYRIQATDLAPSVLTAISPWNGAIPFHVTGVYGSTYRHVGLLESLLGRQEEAARHLAEAIKMNERMGARPYTALCQLDLAQLILTHGDEPDRAQSLLSEARATFVDLGMDHYAELTSELQV